MADEEKTVSFRAKSDKIQALDELAEAQDRPRSYLINEAISQYLDLHAYQDELVRKGIEAVKQGKTVPHGEVEKRWRRRLRGSR